MPGIDAVSALSLWEGGGQYSALDRAVLLAAHIAGISHDAAADLPLHQRDRLLISELHRLGAGTVSVVAHCPECRTLHEADIALAPLLDSHDTPDAAVTLNGRSAAIRAPSSRQLAAILNGGAPSELGKLCCEDEAMLADPRAGAAIETALENAFPLLNIMIAMQCDDCGLPFARRFDPVPLLWARVAVLAQRALADVDVLARTYGWSEAEIFALSPVRRQHYCALALL
jgi:hypothetical protein